MHVVAVVLLPDLTLLNRQLKVSYRHKSNTEK